MSGNKIQVMIAGMTYTLVTDNDEAEIQKIADYVDKKIKEVNNDKLTREMQLVLASLNITDEMYRLAVEYKKLQTKASEPLEKYPHVSKELDKIKAENEKIKEEYERSNQEFIKSVEKIEDLNTRINELTSQIDRQDKINKTKDEDLRKSRDNINSLQKQLSELQKENEILKRDI